MRAKAIGLAVLTTVLWSGSYILNKLAFAQGIGALTLSGLRYLLAALLLLALGSGRKQRNPESRTLAPWVIAGLGVLGYAAGQGLQYAGQAFLTPTQSSLCLSVGNTAMVMLVDRLWLRENQTRGDLIKLSVLLGGILLFYFPWDGQGVSAPGLALMAASSVAYAAHMTLNRHLRVHQGVDTGMLVARPMLAGAMVLLAIGLWVEGVPRITGELLLILGYLSGVSGALGFWLWTYSQKALTAFESSGINNLMLLEIALLDALVFQRRFSITQGLAIGVVFAAIVAIQWKPRLKRAVGQ